MRVVLMGGLWGALGFPRSEVRGGGQSVHSACKMGAPLG